MKKQRVTVLILVIAIFAASYFIANSPIASAVPIPAEINMWLEGVLFSAITAGFLYLFQFTGLDLRGFATEIAGALSMWVLAELQGLVNTIPATFDPYVAVAFKIIVVILSGVGTLYVIAKQRNSGAVTSLLE